jgi:hypothetical protein
LFQVGDCGRDRLEQIVQLALKFLDFAIDYLLVHLPAGFFIDEVVVNVLFFGEAFHVEGHFLLVHELRYIHHVGVDIVAAELFFEQA